MERLKGFNLGGWFSQVDCIEEKDPQYFVGNLRHYKEFIGDKELTWINEAEANHVRLPVDYFNIFDKISYAPNEEVLEILDEKIKMIRSYGLKVIFDLHKCPGHDFHLGATQVQTFFTDPSERTAACQIWEYLAERYGGDEDIYLEILNEPVASKSYQWNDVVVEISKIIRKHAPNNTIVVGSNLWNHPSTFADLEVVKDQNVLYSFHMYEPLLFTHQRATWITNPNFNQVTEFPGEYKEISDQKAKLPMNLGYWDENRIREFLKPVLEFRDKTNHPIACNEFGVFLKASREGQLNWITSLLNVFREYDIGYSYWNFKNLDFGLHSVGESLHESLPQYQNEDRLDRELLNILGKG